MMEEEVVWICDNDVDGKVFNSLTDEDLRNIGISSLGYRKKILALKKPLLSGVSMKEHIATNQWGIDPIQSPQIFVGKKTPPVNQLYDEMLGKAYNR